MSVAQNACSPSYDIRVISLQDSYERRARITRQMGEQQLPFEFFDAIDARQLTESDLSAIRVMHRPYEGMNRGAIAVGKSHYELIKNWVESKQSDYLVVMEDDAEITHQLKEFMNNSKCLNKLRFSILKIGGRYQKRDRPALIVENKGLTITYPFLPSFCNVAYIVNRKGAARVVSHLARFDYDIDEKLTKNARIGMPVYEVSPFIVEESGLPSTLAGYSSTRRRIASLPVRRIVNNLQIAKRITITLINHILFSRKKFGFVRIK